MRIPNGIEELTADWLTSALAASVPGITVTEATLLDVLHGSAAKARIQLSATGPADVPASLLVKGAFTEGLGDDAVAQVWHQLMVMLNQAEVRFYEDDAAAVGDRTPRCYYAAADDRASVLVLEDLRNREGIGFGSFDRPLGPDAMASVLDVLATLHASRWDDEELARSPLSDGMLDGGMLDGFLSEVNWNQQMSRPRGRRVPEALTDHRCVTAAIRRVWACKRSGPQCLIHGDPHIGNYFFDTSGAGLLDWQLCTSGHWASDVVYAIASAMEIDDRRTHEGDLLRHYLDRLSSLGVSAPAFDEAWFEYRKFSLWGFIALLTPGEGVQTEEYNATVGERHAVAAVDLDAVGALNVTA
jgi:Ecdysteroid kinase-like family